MSYYAPVCIFVKSDTAVDGFGLNCLACDQAPHWGNKTKKKTKSVSEANRVGVRKKVRVTEAPTPFPPPQSTAWLAFFPTVEPFPMLNIPYLITQ